MRISFVGSGALASGLARLLRARGVTIAEIISRNQAASRQHATRLARAVGAKAVTIGNATLDCDVLWLAVPDEAIAGVAGEVAGEVARKLAAGDSLPPVVLHASGAMSSAALSVLRPCGVHIGSAHPMMTFVQNKAQSKAQLPEMVGAWFALEGDRQAVAAARRIARALGALSFLLDAERKALYHAFGAMLSPMLASELQAAERIGLQAGIRPADLRRIMGPIVTRTVQNVLRRGAEKSFSGPLARGDVQTVSRHLKALRGTAELPVYRVLASYAVDTLPVKREREMRKLLGGKKSRA